MTFYFLDCLNSKYLTHRGKDKVARQKKKKKPNKLLSGITFIKNSLKINKKYLSNSSVYNVDKSKMKKTF